MKSTLKQRLASLVMILAVIVLFQSCKDEKTRPKKVKEPAQAISYKLANILEEEFKSTRGDTINKYLKIRDTREFWFALDSLKKYIKYVEYEADRLGYTNLGIRIYNGAYPKEKSYPDPGYSTIFLLPTGDKTTSKAAFQPIITNAVTEDNIEEISGYNYAHAGRPPVEVN